MTDHNAIKENASGQCASTVGLGLLPCPFCNQAPVVEEYPSLGLVVISCTNKPGCGIQPSTFEEGLRFELAKRNWNQRPNSAIELLAT